MKLLRKRGYTLKAVASVEFPPEEMDDVEAKIFGCEPEYCIYNRNEENKIMRVNPPEVPEDSTFRSCGGHIHIGHIAANYDMGGDPAQMISLMDSLVGVVSVILDKDPTSLARKKLYGIAGSHRTTNYGVEYRTPSNFWLTNPVLARLIYKLTRKAVEFMLVNPNVFERYIDKKDVKTIINTADFTAATQLLEDYSRVLPPELLNDIEAVLKRYGHNPFFMNYWQIKDLAA